MPRDLQALADEVTLKGMAEITQSPDAMTSLERGDGPRIDHMADIDHELNPHDSLHGQLALVEEQRQTKRDELHPYTQTLTVSDIPSCQSIEDATFPPHERCTDAKFRYRLTKCPELSLGIFTSHAENQIPTAATSAPVDTGEPERKAVLLGHIISTRSLNATVTDADMALPTPDDDGSAGPRGHQESGRTICVHSLAVLPGFQGKGLGRTLMLAYIDRMQSQGMADRLALIAHDHLIPFYEKLGFRNLGESACQFGGGGWHDMVCDLT